MPMLRSCTVHVHVKNHLKIHVQSHTYVQCPLFFYPCFMYHVSLLGVQCPMFVSYVLCPCLVSSVPCPVFCVPCQWPLSVSHVSVPCPCLRRVQVRVPCQCPASVSVSRVSVFCQCVLSVCSVSVLCQCPMSVSHVSVPRQCPMSVSDVRVPCPCPMSVSGGHVPCPYPRFQVSCFHVSCLCPCSCPHAPVRVHFYICNMNLDTDGNTDMGTDIDMETRNGQGTKT
jgi:hypothetical protein